MGVGVAAPPKPADDELNKWAKVHEESVTIHSWMDWLESREPKSLHESRQDLIYEYFDIDANKLEKQRQALLESIR